MNEAARYDVIGDFYLEFVARGLASEETLFYQLTAHLLELLPPLAGLDVLDLACGEGHLSRQLAAAGARVTGVDLAERNLAEAQRQTPSGAIQYLQADAQRLTPLADGRFDLVVCKMALMDIPDMDAAFAAVARVLRPGGRFVAALLHPCFETPFTMPFAPVEEDETGRFRHHRVQRYFEEGHWRSGGSGVRGHVGAYHRTLSTYLNSLIAAGLQIARLDEPALASGAPDSLERQWHQNIAKILYIEAIKSKPV
ncbi:MAG: methyltransferase domain-containing protein [Ardenticatenales bacterium]|nr:methyltransferase domain-containing protein [Ardenticatenales bacterium]